MTTYVGKRNDLRTTVTVDGKPLDPRLDLRNLAASFEWGYVGSGPYQLALAMLARERDDATALDIYKDFTEAVLADIRDDEWSLDSGDIDRAIENLEPVAMDLQELLRRVRGE